MSDEARKRQEEEERRKAEMRRRDKLRQDQLQRQRDDERRELERKEAKRKAKERAEEQKKRRDALNQQYSQFIDDTSKPKEQVTLNRGFGANSNGPKINHKLNPLDFRAAISGEGNQDGQAPVGPTFGPKGVNAILEQKEALLKGGATQGKAQAPAQQVPSLRRNFKF